MLSVSDPVLARLGDEGSLLRLLEGPMPWTPFLPAPWARAKWGWWWASASTTTKGNRCFRTCRSVAADLGASEAGRGALSAPVPDCGDEACAAKLARHAAVVHDAADGRAAPASCPLTRTEGRMRRGGRSRIVRRRLGRCLGGTCGPGRGQPGQWDDLTMEDEPKRPPELRPGRPWVPDDDWALDPAERPAGGACPPMTGPPPLGGGRRAPGGLKCLTRPGGGEQPGINPALLDSRHTGDFAGAGAGPARCGQDLWGRWRAGRSRSDRHQAARSASRSSTNPTSQRPMRSGHPSSPSGS